MNSSDKFSRKLETTAFTVESADAPKVKSGGSSSSNVINRYHEAVAKDVAGLALATNQLSDKASRISNAVAAQSGALSSNLSTLSGRLDALASGSTLLLATLFDNKYISTSGSDTTAEVNSLFGQATLPIRSQVNLLTQQNVQDDYIVSSEVRLSYSYEANPDQFQFTESNEGIAMLLRKQAWLGRSDQPVWIKLTAPLQYLGLPANMIEIYPMPAFNCAISDLSYQLAGAGPGSTWYDVDCSYLPNYNPSSLLGDNVLEMIGPVRAALPVVPMAQIRFRLHPSSGVNWGLFDLRVLSVEFEQTGVLTLINPYNSTGFSSATIRGKDPSDLAQLTTSTTLNKFRIDLSSTSSQTSPIITGALLSLS